MATTVHINDETEELMDEIRDIYEELGVAKPPKAALVKKALKSHKESLSSKDERVKSDEG